MPPVFGPLSPSKTRLWSCAAASGSACLAVAQREEARPPRRRGIPRSRPRRRPRRSAPPNIMSMRRLAPRSSVIATTTPLPAASPSALTTIGAPCARDVGQRLVGVGEALIGGGRDVELAAEVLGEALGAFELRRLPAGPNALMPALARSSTRPAASGASGPTTTRSTAFRLAERDHRRDGPRRRAHAFGHLRDAGIAGRAIELGAAAGRRRSPRPARVRGRRSRPGGCS